MTNTIPKLVGVAIVSTVVLLLISMSWIQIDTGHRGVLTTWGQADMSQSLNEGGHFINPIGQQIHPMSIQTLKYVNTVQSASKDLQVVSSEVTVNHRLIPDKVNVVYKEIGIGYEDVIINPIVSETVKQVTAKYNAENLIKERPTVKLEIEKTIEERLNPYNILVEQVSITDFDFSNEYNSAIERKQVAEQDAKTAVNRIAQFEAEAQQKRAFAEGEKLKAIELAQGEAEATRLRGDADAYKLNVVGQALKNNPDLLTLENIQKWNGVLPYFFSGDGESPNMLLGISPPTSSNP